MASRVISLASIALFAVLAIGVVNCAVVKDVSGSGIMREDLRDITVVEDISEFKKNHPGLTLLPLKRDSGKGRTQTVRYTLNARVSGDRLVAQAADAFNYDAEKDVTIQLTYPQAGAGSIITYVEIVCQQDSNDGNAYVVAGGIGQRFISIVLEASQTLSFSYNAQYYGTD